MQIVCNECILNKLVCMLCASCLQYVCIKSALLQGFKDPMHGNEHGISMLTTKCTVIKLRRHGEKLKLSPGALVKGLKTRLLNLCDSPFVQHITLLTLGNQKILEGLEVIDKEVRTKKKTR